MAMKTRVLASAVAGAIALLGSSTLRADLQRGFFPNAASTQFADVTGDGRADAIAIGDGMVSFGGVNTGDGPGITVRAADPLGNRFGPSQWFTTDMFVGVLATVFADVDGDGAADGIAVDQTGISVRFSDRSQLLPRVSWIGRRTLSGSLPSDSRFTFANVDGRPGVEAIAISPGVGGFPQVFLASGSDRRWAPAPVVQGELFTLFADVTGDGHADAVAINQADITVQVQNGDIYVPFSFDPPVPFTNEPFFGNLDTRLADADGDGLADVIAINSTGTLVRLSDGTQFRWCTRSFTYQCSPDHTSDIWTSARFTGEVGTYFAPVAHRNTHTLLIRPVDAIAVSRSGITVRSSTGVDFGPPVDFTSVLGQARPFFGEANPIFVGFRFP